jgi:hypothetical protein
MNSHKIIYLDQNYISNMAKAIVGRIRDKALAKFWLSIFEDLKKAVLLDKITCPESNFHKTEAMFDKTLEEPLIKVIAELSMGLKFRSWQDILEGQIIEAARLFVGKHNNEKKWWTIAFESDPNASVESRMIDINGIKVRINSHFFLPKEIAEHNRQKKLQFVDKSKELIDKYSEKPLKWPELLFESKKSTLDGILGNTARKTILEKAGSSSIFDQISAINGIIKYKNLDSKLSREIGVDNKNLQKFLFSNELFDIPFVDISSSIWAVIAELSIHGRKSQIGDFYDVPILSVALPYCNIITTDKFMKEILINKLHFNDKYNVRIFSAIETDTLEFQKLVRELTSD